MAQDGADADAHAHAHAHADVDAATHADAGARSGADARKGAGPDADPEQVAQAICLRQLTLGPRTKAQLGRAMALRNVPEHVAESVLQRLEDVGLVDDAVFAAAWVDSRHTGRGLGRKALEHELRQRGVTDSLVREAIDQMDPERELAAARQLVAGRLAAMQGLDPQTRARRLGGVLARKGYPAGLAHRVIREAIEADAATDADAGNTG